MDPFEVRMQFMTLLSRLTSSVQSLSKVSSFALKHATRCSDDIWDCYLDEMTHTPNLNHRINLLYLLDSLLDKEGPKVVDRSAVGGVVGQGSYRALVERDLVKVVLEGVPESREGVLNYMSAMQVLKSWRTRRLVDAEILDVAVSELDARKASLTAQAPESTEDKPNGNASSRTTFTNFSRNDILRRIEDDRERHKRLRERIWVLPIPSVLFNAPLVSSSSSSFPSSSTTTSSQKPSPVSPASPFEPSTASNPSLNTSQSLHRSAATSSRNVDRDGTGGSGTGSSMGRGPELALEIEFDQLFEAAQEERRLVFGQDDDTDEEQPGRKRRKVWQLSEAEREELRKENARCFA